MMHLPLRTNALLLTTLVLPCAFVLVGCHETSQRDAPPAVVSPRPAPGPRVSPPAPPREPARTTRREGNLVVEWPTRRARLHGGRLRAHVAGPLDAAATRYWVGPSPVPKWLPLHRGALELFVLDETPEGFLALYREPYGATESGCGLGGLRHDKNCQFVVTHYAPDHSERWVRRLNDFLSRPDHLEVQDVRYSDGVVYFNEGCQSYSRDADGRCSSLVALDPIAGRVLFRTQPLVSNGKLAVIQAHVLASYGFSAERDWLSLVSRTTGRVAARMALPVSAEHIEVVATSPTRAVLDVELAGRATPWRVAVEALDRAAPRFVPEGPAPDRAPSRFRTLRLGMRDPVR